METNQKNVCFESLLLRIVAHKQQKTDGRLQFHLIRPKHHIDIVSCLEKNYALVWQIESTIFVEA